MQQETPVGKRERWAAWYDRHLGRLIPHYALVSLPFCLISVLLYFLAQILPRFSEPVNIMSAWDRAIPLRSEWVLIYFGSYVSWIVNFVMIARRGREYWFRFFAAFFTSSVITFIVFMVFPATMDQPEITGTGFFAFCMRLMYSVDNPINLLPSFHCLTSWFCAVGLHSDGKTPLWFRIASYVFALMVFASTLFVRQHCIIDVVVGVALAQIMYLLFRKGRLYLPFRRWMERLEQAAFGFVES